MSLPLDGYTAWPSAAQVQATLRGAGLLGDIMTDAQTAFDWDGTIAAVISDFQSATKRTPFLAEETAITIPIAIERPSKVLNLPASYVEITAVTIKTLGRGGSGETPDALVENEDFVLCPLGAVTLGKPITSIELFPPFTRRTNSLLSITGRRGYAKKIPADVYQAVLENAAVRAEAALRGSIDDDQRTIEKKVVGDVETTYATSVTERTRLTSQAATSWAAVTKRYKRFTIA